MPKETTQPVAPLLAGDEARYRREWSKVVEQGRYRTLKELVDELSDESNLLALRVYNLQRAIYDHHMHKSGRPPPRIKLPSSASWAPLIGNHDAYPANTGAPPRKNRRERINVDEEIEGELDDDDRHDSENGEQPEDEMERGQHDDDELDMDPQPEPVRKPAKRAPRTARKPRVSRDSKNTKARERKEREREREREKERELERAVDDEIGDELDLAASAPQSPHDMLDDDY